LVSSKDSRSQGKDTKGPVRNAVSKYLGQRLRKGTIAEPEYWVTAMAQFKQPFTKSDLIAFFDTIEYY